MKKSILVYCIVTLMVSHLEAQVKFRVGKSSDNTFTKGESAKVLYTDPSSEATSSSWLVQGYVDAGYTVRLSQRDKLSLTINGELQRNTLIEKKQDTRQYGFSADNKFEFLDPAGVAKSMLNTTLSIKHSDDRIKNKTSMQYMLGFTYYAANNASTASWAAKLFTPGLYCPVGRALAIVFDHNVSGVVMNEQESMYLSMVQANAGVDAYLFHDFFKQKLSNPRTLFVYANWNGRHALQDEVDNDMNAMKKAGIGVDFSLLSVAQAFNAESKDVDNRIIIKYEWVNGADPLKGLANQKYRQLTLNLIINI